MEKSTIIGLILGFGALIGGMIAKGANPVMLLNPAAIIIILVGTVAAVSMAFPMTELRRVPKLFNKIMKTNQSLSERELLPLFVKWAKVIRKDGIIALEKEINDINDPFLKHGITLVLEGQDPADIRKMLEEDLQSRSDRHASGALIFTQAGTYAPTLGVMGAVMGLVGALGHLDDIAKLGSSISAAFMATLLGIFTGYVLWHPIANKLKRISAREIEVGYFVVEGIAALQESTSPILVKRKLTPYLPLHDREWLETEEGGS